MTKIKESFDSITVSNKLKEKTYQNIKIHLNKRNEYKRLSFISLSVTFACILIGLFLYNCNNFSKNNLEFNTNGNDNDLKVLTTESPSNTDSFIYDNHTYIISKRILNQFMLDIQIGTLNKTDNLNKNFDSYYHDKAPVYTIRGVNDYKELAVLERNQVLIYIME